MLATMHYQHKSKQNRQESEPLLFRDKIYQSSLQYFRTAPEEELNKDHYAAIMGTVERALLEKTLQHCKQNRSKAAAMLGLNRGTFRAKLLAYGLEAN